VLLVKGLTFFFLSHSSFYSYSAMDGVGVYACLVSALDKRLLYLITLQSFIRILDLDGWIAVVVGDRRDVA
jgi:hypothetical protein